MVVSKILLDKVLWNNNQRVNLHYLVTLRLDCSLNEPFELWVEEKYDQKIWGKSIVPGGRIGEIIVVL